MKRVKQVPSRNGRIDLEREVILDLPNLGGVTRERSLNISTTGMFVRHPEPPPPGTVLSFESSLNDLQPAIRGHGEVVWVRRHDEAPDRPAGMGIRFLDLGREGRKLIRWMIAVRSLELSDSRAAARDAGDAKRTTPARAAATPVVVESTLRSARSDLRKLSSYAGSAAPVRSRRAITLRGRPALLLASLAACTIYLLVGPAEFARQQGGAIPAETTKLDPAGAGDPERQLIEVARAWAGAWSDQRVDDYFRFYSQEFRPSSGVSRGDWEAQRRARILRPRQIHVELSDFEAEPLSGERARVSFDQTYRSEQYSDTVRKILELVREDGHWRILVERSGA